MTDHILIRTLLTDSTETYRLNMSFTFAVKKRGIREKFYLDLDKRSSLFLSDIGDDNLKILRDMERRTDFNLWNISMNRILLSFKLRETDEGTFDKVQARILWYGIQQMGFHQQ